MLIYSIFLHLDYIYHHVILSYSPSLKSPRNACFNQISKWISIVLYCTLCFDA